MNLFISYSFQKNDKKVYDNFLRLLGPIVTEKGIKFITARKPEPKHPVEQIFPLIDQSDFCLVIATRTDFKSSKNKYATSPWIYGELVYALIKKKPVMIFSEDGVELGSLPTYFTQIESFKRNKIIEISEILRDYVEACVKQIEKNKILKHEDVYEMEEFCSRDTVYRDGHGISAAKIKLKLKTSISETLKIKHYVDMCKCIRKNSFLDNLEVLYKKDIRERFKEQTFSFESNMEGNDEIKVSFGEYEKGKGQEFFVEVPIAVQKELIEEDKPLIYYWGVSFPHMYPISKNELKSGKLKTKLEEDINTEISAFHETKKLVFSIDFEKGHNFSKKPYFTMYDWSSNCKKEAPPLLVRKRLYYDRYEVEINNCVKNESYIIRWVPK